MIRQGNEKGVMPARILKMNYKHTVTDDRNTACTWKYIGNLASPHSRKLDCLQFSIHWLLAEGKSFFQNLGLYTNPNGNTPCRICSAEHLSDLEWVHLGCIIHIIFSKSGPKNTLVTININHMQSFQKFSHQLKLNKSII